MLQMSEVSNLKYLGNDTVDCLDLLHADKDCILDGYVQVCPTMFFLAMFHNLLVNSKFTVKSYLECEKWIRFDP